MLWFIFQQSSFWWPPTSPHYHQTFPKPSQYHKTTSVIQKSLYQYSPQIHFLFHSSPKWDTPKTSLWFLGKRPYLEYSWVLGCREVGRGRIGRVVGGLGLLFSFRSVGRRCLAQFHVIGSRLVVILKHWILIWKWDTFCWFVTVKSLDGIVSRLQLMVYDK